jgi:hypothetical protein
MYVMLVFNQSVRLFCTLIIVSVSFQFSISQTVPDNGICLLRNDTIFKLNLCSDGKLNFIPWFIDSTIKDLNAVSFNYQDSFFYGFNQKNANLIRFRPFNNVEDLGRPISKEEELPNEDLIATALAGDEIFVLAASTNSIYAIDIKKRPLSFRTVVKNIAYGLPNGLSFNPLNNKLFLIDQNGTAINIDPENGKQEIIPKNGSFANFPRKKQLSYGKVWFTDKKRCFFLVGLEGQLYELDTEKRIAYFIENTGFVSTKAAFFFGGEPDFIDREILSFKIHPYPHGNEILELEWFENNPENLPVNYYAEKYVPKLNKWIEIGFIPGYASTGQANRYTILDRSPSKGENCYRLRKSYFDKIKYSKVVCTKDEQNKAIIRLSDSFADSESITLHFQHMEGSVIELSVKHYLSDTPFIKKYFNIISSDQSYTLSDRLEVGWNFIVVNSGNKTEYLKVFVKSI